MRPDTRILIVTGLSGSGKTVGLRAVEDADFFCVDNIPVSLMNQLITKISGQKGTKSIAIGVDIREKEALADMPGVIDLLRKRHSVEVLFLEAEPDVLVRRFKETRRPHPLGGDIGEAIRSEQQILLPLKQMADRVIDTSTLSPHQLRRIVTTLYASQKSTRDLTVTLISFGFKFGAPPNIDLLFDVRFLPNPYFVPHLKDLRGTDKEVSDYVLRQPPTKTFMRKVGDILNFLIPHYVREGKTYLAIAFGCTGGNHRSPAIVEKMAAFLQRDTVEIRVVHRDIS